MLLRLAREGSPDLRAACLQCLAVLSKQDAFKRRLLVSHAMAFFRYLIMRSADLLLIVPANFSVSCCFHCLHVHAPGSAALHLELHQQCSSRFGPSQTRGLDGELQQLAFTNSSQPVMTFFTVKHPSCVAAQRSMKSSSLPCPLCMAELAPSWAVQSASPLHMPGLHISAVSRHVQTYLTTTWQSRCLISSAAIVMWTTSSSSPSMLPQSTRSGY